MSDGLARRWLTVDQAATVTGRSRRTVERWLRDGRLDAVTLRGRRMLNELDVLTVERATRRAHHGARPPAVLAQLDTGDVLSPHRRRSTPRAAP